MGKEIRNNFRKLKVVSTSDPHVFQKGRGVKYKILHKYISLLYNFKKPLSKISEACFLRLAKTHFLIFPCFIISISFLRQIIEIALFRFHLPVFIILLLKIVY